MRLAVLCAGLVLAAAPALAQSDLAALLARGDTAYDRYAPGAAVRAYEAALALDSTDYAANWKAARSLVDSAKQLADSLAAVRDSLYGVAQRYAERALRRDTTRADAHFALALALGQLSRTRGGKERVRFAGMIFEAASRAVALDSTHDGAHHVLGAWHAEVMRLSGIQKFFARTLFNAGPVINRGNWDDAVRHLERAVALRPDYVFHRLELAEVYAELKRYRAARELLATIPPLPQSDVLDARYQRDATALAARIRDRRDPR
jgi:tetratricopeptide (TPR) repeat protein